MRKFITPKNKRGLIKWFLEYCTKNEFTVVFEYKDQKVHQRLSSLGIETNLPPFIGHQYQANYQLTALQKVAVTEGVVQFLLQDTAVMTVCCSSKILFLAADGYHPQCFSIAEELYESDINQLKYKGLVDKLS